jgi:hypothetical protein
LASIHHPPCDGGVAHRLREPRTTDNLPNGSLLTWSVTNEAAVMLPDQAFSRATGTNVDSAFNQTTRLIKRIIHRRHFVSYLAKHGAGPPGLTDAFQQRSVSSPAHGTGCTGSWS